METRFVDTKRGLAVTWAVFAFAFGTGFSLLMGDPRSDSLVFGLAMGVGAGIGVSLFFRPKQ